MMTIKSYPKRLFDKMVRRKEYGIRDSFISIGYSNIENSDFFDDEPVILESEHYLRILFDDVLITEPLLKVKAITLDQGKEIVDFLKRVPTDGTLHVHCQAGQSRSVAVAQCAAMYFESIDVKASVEHMNPDHSPNLTVSQTLSKFI